jgi:spoIIIJ-associated protein
MDWVETRGRTVEEAKDRALDQLGVSAADADFEVLEEPRSGLFGLRRTEARVRARVRPKAPRPKLDRRSRAGRERAERTSGEKSAAPAGVAKSSGGEASASRSSRRRRRGGGAGAAGGRPAPAPSTVEAITTPSEQAPSAPARQRAGANAETSRADTGNGEGRTRNKESTMTDNELAVFAPEEQAAVVCRFLDGVVSAFGLQASTTASVEDGVLHANVDGASLGLLIGPRGGTLRALQELAWTTLQREAGGRTSAQVRVDVAGFVQRRRAALEAFARTQAAEVRASGQARSLEAMSSADRKVVHDALVDEPGVSTISEGDDPHRRVVILPSAD